MPLVVVACRVVHWIAPGLRPRQLLRFVETHVVVVDLGVPAPRGELIIHSRHFIPLFVQIVKVDCIHFHYAGRRWRRFTHLRRLLMHVWRGAIARSLLVNEFETRQDSTHLAVLTLNVVLVVACWLGDIFLHSFRSEVGSFLALLDLVFEAFDPLIQFRYAHVMARNSWLNLFLIEEDLFRRSWRQLICFQLSLSV